MRLYSVHQFSLHKSSFHITLKVGSYNHCCNCQFFLWLIVVYKDHTWRVLMAEVCTLWVLFSSSANFFIISSIFFLISVPGEDQIYQRQPTVMQESSPLQKRWTQKVMDWRHWTQNRGIYAGSNVGIFSLILDGSWAKCNQLNFILFSREQVKDVIDKLQMFTEKRLYLHATDLLVKSSEFLFYSQLWCHEYLSMESP